ncbi:MAG: hypothetical protein HC831_28095 [Chloroflexia bacterium]|nr:hypothetical protein [Chloroflexia bacterium]
MEHLIKFKGKNVSWVKNLNLLYKERNIYVMDNHNAALWCWLQEMDMSKKYNILHIDKHYDTKASQIDEWLSNIPANLQLLTIDQYLALKYKNPNAMGLFEVMHWDNYLTIFHELYKKNIRSYHFFTHKQGSLYEDMAPMMTEYPIPGLFNLIELHIWQRKFGVILNGS